MYEREEDENIEKTFGNILCARALTPGMKILRLLPTAD